MVINAYGVLSDYHNRVLLQREAQSETLVPPGRMVESGQLPADQVAAAFREETGLIVLPLRLTGLYFRPGKPDSLFFCFRCLLRGGNLAIPPGQSEAGFFDSQPLPRPLRSMHQQQVSQALRHTGGRPHWEAQALSVGTRLRSWLEGSEGQPATTSWRVTAVALTRDQRGHIGWVKRPGERKWQLPTTERQPNEAPWDTARRALRAALETAPPLTDLPLVYVGQQQREMTFVFTAASMGDKPASKLETAYFPPGAEPANSHPHHAALVLEALKPSAETRFISQDVPLWPVS